MYKSPGCSLFKWMDSFCEVCSCKHGISGPRDEFFLLRVLGFLTHPVPLSACGTIGEIPFYCQSSLLIQRPLQPLPHLAVSPSQCNRLERIFFFNMQGTVQVYLMRFKRCETWSLLLRTLKFNSSIILCWLQIFLKYYCVHITPSFQNLKFL
jgi:hypothetical protein